MRRRGEELRNSLIFDVSDQKNFQYVRKLQKVFRYNRQRINRTILPHKLRRLFYHLFNRLSYEAIILKRQFN